MTIATLVERERRHLRRSELAFAVLAGTGASALVLAVASVVLGRARWLALPRLLPFLVWALVASVLAVVALHSRRRLRRNGSRADVAGAIEREHPSRPRSGASARGARSPVRVQRRRECSCCSRPRPPSATGSAP